MHSGWLKIYHRLPAPARSVAASVNGLYLRRWRYGLETQQLVDVAQQREHWDADQWARWREARLAEVLQRAATRVPYYRDYWAARRRNGSDADWAELANWPILEKETVRAHPLSFVADDCRVRRMFHEQTSGTTGTPLDLWFRRETVRAYYALYERRNRGWFGVSRHDRWAILGGRLVTPAARRRPPFWVWNLPLNQLYMSSYHLAPHLVPCYLDALKKHRIRFLLGYTSALYAIAQEAIRLGRRDLRMRVVITNAEPLLDYQRRVIAEAFECPVRETYGMSEIVAAATECTSGSLHLWPSMGHVEVIEGDRPAPPEVAGDLVCTGLLNADMPLIRYRVGDRGALAAESGPCRCGRTLPILTRLEGRSDDVLLTRDGRRIGRLDPIFKSPLPVREAQIIQESLQRIRVRYCPAPNYTCADGNLIAQRLRERMGDVEVILEPVDRVPLSANGKFRAVICSIPNAQREAFR